MGSTPIARYVYETGTRAGKRVQALPTLAAAAATLAGTCLLASWLPARRASRIDPAEMLREG